MEHTWDVFKTMPILFLGNRTFFLSENQLVAVSLADQRSELRGQYSNYYSNSRACAPLKLNMEPEN